MAPRLPAPADPYTHTRRRSEAPLRRGILLPPPIPAESLEARHAAAVTAVFKDMETEIARSDTWVNHATAIGIYFLWLVGMLLAFAATWGWIFHMLDQLAKGALR